MIDIAIALLQLSILFFIAIKLEGMNGVTHEILYLLRKKNE